MGLLARFRGVASHANQAINQGEVAIHDIREVVVGTIEEVLDGFTVEMVVPKGSAGTLQKLLAAALAGVPLEADLVLPIGFRVTLKE